MGHVGQGPGRRSAEARLLEQQTRTDLAGGFPADVEVAGSAAEAATVELTT